MLRQAIEYKVIEAGGVFVEVPTRTVKPSQTCPNCGNQHKKLLDERVHQCKVCGFTMDHDLAAALVMGACQREQINPQALTPSPSPKKRERGARLPVPLLPSVGEGVRG